MSRSAPGCLGVTRSWSAAIATLRAGEAAASQPAISPPPAPPKPRLLVYSHDGTGLGHLRITLPIAIALARHRPDAAVLFLTGSQHIDTGDLPSNLDYVKLPSMPKRRLYEGLPPPPQRPAPFKNVVYLREAVARATIEAFAPHLLIVDHAPAGLFGEIAAALDRLDRSRPQPASVFLMRDITFGAKQTRDLWGPERAFDFLDRVYDRILVYGSRELYDPIAEYQISPTAAAKTRFCGYLRPPAPTRAPAEIRRELGASGRPLVVVTVGGGADGGAIVRAYLGALDHGPPGDLVSFVVTGPLLDQAERQAITAFADRHPNLTVRAFHPDLISYLHAADLIVTMGGYNAIIESVVTGKPTLVIPRKPGSEEQLIRGERFAERGFVDLLPPDEITPQRLGAAIVSGLRREERPVPALPLDGREAIMDELLSILSQRFPLPADSA